MRLRVLVVDDEPSMRDLVRVLAGRHHDVVDAGDLESGLRALAESVPDVLVTDYAMPGGSGLDLARRALALMPDLAVVVMTGMAWIPEFVELFRVGVADVLQKPFSADQFERTLVRALETRRLRAENARLREALRATDPLADLVGGSAAMESLREQIRATAPTDATVLVTGSSGTGKELVARAIHRLSPRSGGPFVAVHAGAFSPTLIEGELFGHARGAFTGAGAARAGLFESAEGGTLFLDEIGTMGEGVQTRLLRVLQDRAVVRVGESHERRVDVRFVAATNLDLAEAVARGSFRQDLYYRLDVVNLALPDLAQRRDDIPALAAQFVAQACRRAGRATKSLSQAAVRQLLAHDWPGNVRELENAMEAAVIHAGASDVIDEVHLLGAPSAPARRLVLPEEGGDLGALLAQEEARWMRQALERAEGRPSEAAALLRMSRSTFARRMKALGIRA